MSVIDEMMIFNILKAIQDRKNSKKSKSHRPSQMKVYFGN
nr:MAG TPA: hypothetical protein [Caudoviricetes sp.]